MCVSSSPLDGSAARRWLVRSASLVVRLLPGQTFGCQSELWRLAAASVDLLQCVHSLSGTTCCSHRSAFLHCTGLWRVCCFLFVCFCETKALWWISPGIASFPFLACDGVDGACDDSSLRRFRFRANLKTFCFPNRSPVYRKSESGRVRPTIWYVCAACLN